MSTQTPDLLTELSLYLDEDIHSKRALLTDGFGVSQEQANFLIILAWTRFIAGEIMPMSKDRAGFKSVLDEILDDECTRVGHG